MAKKGEPCKGDVVNVRERLAGNWLTVVSSVALIALALAVTASGVVEAISRMHAAYLYSIALLIALAVPFSQQLSHYDQRLLHQRYAVLFGVGGGVLAVHYGEYTALPVSVTMAFGACAIFYRYPVDMVNLGQLALLQSLWMMPLAPLQHGFGDGLIGNQLMAAVLGGLLSMLIIVVLLGRSSNDSEEARMSVA